LREGGKIFRKGVLGFAPFLAKIRAGDHAIFKTMKRYHETDKN